MHALCWARPHRHYFHPKGINIIYGLPKIKDSLVKEHVALLVTFSMLGKLAITSSYGTVCIFLIFFSDLTGKTKSHFPGLHLLCGALPHGGEERGDGHLLLVRQDRWHHLPLHQHAQV